MPERQQTDDTSVKSFSKNIHPDTLVQDNLTSNYVTVAPSSFDEIHFGRKFSPYKIEANEVEMLKGVIDSFIVAQKGSGYFRDFDSAADYKFKITSVRTAKGHLQARVQAICKEAATSTEWYKDQVETKDGGDCYFSLIYDLTDKKIIEHLINVDV
ncbi:MAG: hypothetical protein EOP48_21510 [Sphingobacteriales bacterium]|nr:MAG: hypothetical protein EOP48_21510 [Sphingobacteriales bacterium]